MCKLPKPMNLKQFMVYREVVTLYLQIMRTIKHVPKEEDRKYLKDWARAEFKANKNITDEVQIKYLINHGQVSLNELKKSLNMSQ